jgi:hypothetical protein
VMAVMPALAVILMQVHRLSLTAEPIAS